jgi:serine phosphatase RsbU (regulator of sigma subunit)/anti-sigma regulatory factor (Ser/Thr protein kinase)
MLGSGTDGVSADDVVARARRTARDAAGAADDLAFASELVASELVTNAVLHAGGVADVAIRAIDGGVRIEVADRTRDAPFVAVASDDAMTGRGLALVARLASRWGAEPREGGKVVWAEVTGAVSTSSADIDDLLAAWDHPFDDGDVPSVTVHLGDVDTALLLAAKRHVDNLVREFTLAAADTAWTETAVPAHVTALIDLVVHRFEGPRLQMKRQATAAAIAGRRFTALEITVPADIEPLAVAYRDALDEIDGWCRENRILTLETPPEHRAFRHWYIAQLIAQVRAANAGQPAPPVLPFDSSSADHVQDDGTLPEPRLAGPSAIAVATVAIGLCVTLLFVWLVQAAHRDNEERLLTQRAREAASVLRAAVPSVESPLRAAATSAALIAEPSADSFRRVAASSVGDGRTFVSMSIWPTAMSRPSVVVGDPPLLESAPAPRAADIVRRASGGPTMAVTGLLDGTDRRLGYAVAAAGDRTQVVYAEQRLPADATGVEPDPAFAGFDYALFLGTSAQRSNLLFASTRAIEPSRRIARETIPFGDTSMLLVMAASHELGGRLLADLAWIVLGTGLALTLSAAGVVEFVQRRRAIATRLATENRALYEGQRAIAVTLQRSLLPQAIPSVPGIDVAARYFAGVEDLEIGGDWYDVIAIDGRLVAIVGDVSGRGVAAASVMASARHSARVLATQGHTPAEILAGVNRLVALDAPERFATMVCVALDPATGAGVIASAGHPPPVVLAPDGSTTTLPVVPGLPVGTVDDSRFIETGFSLPRGGTLVAYTDGLIERRDQPIDIGIARLTAVLAGAGGSAADVADRVVHALHPARATDDTAVLVVRRTDEFTSHTGLTPFHSALPPAAAPPGRYGAGGVASSSEIGILRRRTHRTPKYEEDSPPPSQRRQVGRLPLLS